MKIPSLTVLEDFFGVPPELHGPDEEDLFHNRITFTAEIEGDTIWFEVSPWAAAAHLRLSTSPFRIVDFHFDEVAEVSIRRTAEDHNMFIHHGGSKRGECNVKIRPHIMIFYANSPTEDDEPLLFAAGDGEATAGEI